MYSIFERFLGGTDRLLGKRQEIPVQQIEQNQEKTTGAELFVNAYTGIDKQYQERFFPFDSIP